jgi:hypothetical protein
VMIRSALALLVVVPLAACTTVNSVDPASGEVRSQPGVKLTQNETVSAETLAVGGGLLVVGLPSSAVGLSGEVFSKTNVALLYIIYDPLAPNWTIKETAIDGENYRLSLRAKHFRTGGDGEAMQVFRRRALQLQREKGYSGYRLLGYTEGIESSTPFTYRVSEGTIQLVKTP